MGNHSFECPGPPCFSVRTFTEVLRTSEHFPPKDAGYAQQVQFTKQQAMPCETERPTDLPVVWDAFRGQFLRYGFSNEFAICQGLEWVQRYPLRVLVLLSLDPGSD